MARDEAPPFARGESFYNGMTIDLANLGGANFEGKDYVFEVNTPDDPTMADPSGRSVKVKVVRNLSGVNIKPARITRYSTATTTSPYQCAVDGYCTQVSDRPAGVSDEFLPAAGVPPNDLFYVVLGGPTQIQQGATTAASVTVGARLVSSAYGATAGDDLGGRLALQDVTGTAATLANNVQNAVGYSQVVNNTAAAFVPVIANLKDW